MNDYSKIMQCAPEWVLPNPYQPREREDLAHVAKIAESILQEGLLQVAVGRLMPNRTVELAFGHTRLAAYKLLNRLAIEGKSEGLDLTEFPGLARLLAGRVAGTLSEEEQGRWVYFPINLRELGNAEMFRLAVSENLARKDLTALEEARAMVRYRDEFKKTSAEIGDLFGLSESAVRNKMRLLGLPAEVLEGFAAGTLTEGAARELLRLYDLPKSVLRAANRVSYHEHLQPDYIVKCAMSGELAATVKGNIDALINFYKEKLDNAPWKWDEVFEIEEEGEIRALPLCKGCQFNHLKDNQHICLDKGCYWDKHHAWEWHQTQKAAAAVGLPALAKQDGSATNFSFGDREGLRLAREAHCPNLAVVYSGYPRNVDEGGLKDEGHPSTVIICTKRKGFCTCIQAAKAKIELRPAQPAAAQFSAQAAEDTAEPTVVKPEVMPITATELEEVARQARKQKRANADLCRQLLQQAGVLFGDGLREMNPIIWKIFLDRLDYRQKDNKLSLYEITTAIGLILAEGISNPVWQTDPEHAREQYNRTLRSAGLREIESIEEG